MRLPRLGQALPQSVRFLLAGGFAAAVNWLVRFPLSELMPFPAAVAAAAAIGMIVGFLIYRSFVFPASGRPLALQARDFVIVNLVSMVIVTLAAMLLREPLLASLAPPTAEATAHSGGIAIGALANYAGHARLTFHPAAARSTGPGPTVEPHNEDRRSP